MSILGQANFVSANTYYEARASEIFARPQEGLYELFTARMDMKGQALGLETFGPGGSVAELVGDREFGGLREYLKTITAKTYSTKPALELDSKAVFGDLTGALKMAIDEHLAMGPWFWDKVATDMLTGNPSGMDGVALLNSAHPYGSGGGTWNNITTDALGFASFSAGIAAMQGLKGERGEPLNINPTHLMVGPDLERMALEVVGALRPVPFSSSAQDAASSIVAVTTFGNVYEGRVRVIVNKRMTSSTQWFLMDLSKAAKPIALGELQAPYGVAVTDPQSEPMLKRSKCAYYGEGKAACGGWVPHLIYGRAT